MGAAVEPIGVMLVLAVRLPAPKRTKTSKHIATRPAPGGAQVLSGFSTVGPQGPAGKGWTAISRSPPGFLALVCFCGSGLHGVPDLREPAGPGTRTFNRTV